MDNNTTQKDFILAHLKEFGSMESVSRITGRTVHFAKYTLE